MSSINSKLGLKPAGKRRLMRLPANRAEASALTSLACPKCGDHWILENVIHGVRRRMCARCSYGWNA